MNGIGAECHLEGTVWKRQRALACTADKLTLRGAPVLGYAEPKEGVGQSKD
jgi:hypothetical protein